MENIIEKKIEYNSKLQELYETKQKLSNNPDEKEFYESKINEFKNVLRSLSDQIPNATKDELINGFNVINKIEEVQEPEALVIPSERTERNTPVSQSNQNNTTISFYENYAIAEKLSKSTIIPETYRNKPENIVIAIGMAQKLGFDVFTVMQNLNIIKGKTSWTGSFCRTLIEKCNKYTNLRLIFIGEKGKDNYGCYMQAIEKETGEIIKGPEVTIKMAKDEGWTSNKKWITLTDLMLSYRATSFFARIYCPETMNGIQTSEEIEDVYNNKPSKRTVEDVL